MGCVGAEVVLETLSHSPRVFSLYNFMDMEEADNIIEDALGMTQEAYRLKVGAGYSGTREECGVLDESAEADVSYLSVMMMPSPNGFPLDIFNAVCTTIVLVVHKTERTRGAPFQFL